MNKLALVFPGQGSQSPGMGAQLAAAHPAAAAIFQRANAVLGWDLAELCFNGPAGKLSLTEFAQPALYVCSLAAMVVASEKGIRGDVVAGHSLGEFTALAAAGAMCFEAGLQLVARRGEAMSRAARQHPGSMAAVLGLDDSKVEALCKASGQVWPVNYNCPGQLVISGETKAVRQTMRAATGAGAKKVVELPVSGSFHTPLMADAAEELAVVLAGMELRQPEPDFISSISCRYENADGLSELLTRQMVSPVRWRQTIEKLVADGVNTFIEIGSGKVLTGLIKRISRDVRTLNISDSGSLEKTLAAILQTAS